MRTRTYVTIRKPHAIKKIAGTSQIAQSAHGYDQRRWQEELHSGIMTGMSGFSEWVKQQLELHSHHNVADAAHALKIRPSELGRWLGSKRPPTQDTMRTASRIFDVPIREILIAAEYMTMEEASSDGLPVSALSTQELIAELSRRTKSAVVSEALKANQGTEPPNS